MSNKQEQLHKDKDDLQSQLDGVIVANAQLASCNSLLRSKCDQLLEQLSVKEAHWSHREEELQLQVRMMGGACTAGCVCTSNCDNYYQQFVNSCTKTLLG